MEDANTETDPELTYHSEVSTGDKRKREGKLRSKVWQHFTKIIKEDGTCDKCQCNNCHKLFTCSSRSGTTHLLRHVTDGICPAFRKDKDKAVTLSGYVKGSSEQSNRLPPWKFEQGLWQTPAQQCMDVEVELLPDRIPDLEPQMFRPVEDDYGGQTQTPLSSRRKLPLQSAFKPHKAEAWMNEFRCCVTKLMELTNGKIPVGSLQGLAVTAPPDYSISTALKCLNEMEDIDQSSDMYLDAFEILQDAEERECFICLPPEPRRRWLQRMLHRRHPLRYGLNV